MRRWHLIALGFLVSAAYWPGVLAAAFVPRWAVIAVGVPLVFSFRPRNLSAWGMGALLVLVAGGALSLLQAPSAEVGLGYLLCDLWLAGAVVGAASLDDVTPLVEGLFAGFLLSIAVVLVQAAGYAPVRCLSSEPCGLFTSSEPLAEFAVVFAVWALWRHRWAMLGACLVPLAFANSRISWFVLGAASIVWATSGRPRVRAFLVGALIFLGFAAIWLVGTGKFMSAGQRFVLWYATAEAITPLGQGLGWFEMSHGGAMFAHSDLLQALAEIGLPAVALAVFPIICLTARGHHAERACFAVLVFEAVVSFPLHMPAEAFLAACLAGFLARRRDLVRMGLPDGLADDDGRLWGFLPGLRLSRGRSEGLRRPLSARLVVAQGPALRAPLARLCASTGEA